MVKFPFYSLRDAEGEGSVAGGDITAAEISRAAELGHVPLEKWTGPKDKWVNARDYIAKGEEILPIVKAQKRALERQVAELKTTIDATNADVAVFRDFVTKAAERKYQEQMATALKAKEEAIDEGSGKAVTAADKEIARIEKEKADADEAAKKKPAGTATGDHPDYAAWLTDNSWYAEDLDLQAAANIIAHQEARANPSVTGKGLYDKVKARLQKQALWKEKFPEDPAMTMGNIVEGETGNGNRRPGNSKAKTYENLPAEAKAACDKFIANGWITLPGKKDATLKDKREAYCADYDWS